MEKEAEKRREELNAAMEYHSEDEIRDAYGWDYITAAQMDRYIDLLHQGEAALENHVPTVTERTAALLRAISKDVAHEREDYRYDAMTPEELRAELLRRETADREWREHIKTLKQYVAAARGLPETE